MHKYREILILHPIDNSTKFLEPFKDSFGVNYYGFNSDTIYDVKAKLGDLEPKSLIVFIGHGSSRGLYEPDERHIYEKYFSVFKKLYGFNYRIDEIRIKKTYFFFR